MDEIKNDYSAGRKFIGNLFSFSVATWIGALISFCVTPIVTRVFSTEALGKINMFFAFSSLLEYIALFAMNQAYIRFYNEPLGMLSKKDLYRTCISISFLSTLLTCLSIMIFKNKVSLSIIGEIGFIIPLELCLYLLARVFLTMSNTSYRMELNVRMFSIQAILMNLSQKVAFAFAGVTDASAKTAIMYACITSSILIVMFTFFQRELLFEKNRTRAGYKDLETLLKYSLPLIPALFLSYLNTSLPNFLLNKKLDYSAVGVFSTAVTLVQIITLIQTGFNVFWTPFVYSNYKNNQSQIQNIHNIISMVMLIAGVLILTFLDFIYLVLGESFRASQPYFGFMILSPILYTIAETTGLGINVYKKTYLSIVVAGITVVTNLTFCQFLIPQLGTLGAAISIAVSSWAMFVSKTIIGERYYKVVSNWEKTIIGPLIVTFAALINYLTYGNMRLRVGSNALIFFAILFVYRVEFGYIVKVGLSFYKKNIA